MKQKLKYVPLVITLLFLLTIIICVVFLSPKEIKYNIAPEANVYTKRNYEGWGLTEGSWEGSVNDKNPESYWLGQIDKDNEYNWVSLSWNKPQRINSINVSFGIGKNKLATQYKIYTLKDNEWEELLDQESNTRDFVSHNLDNPIQTSGLRVLFTSNLSEDSIQRIDEIYINQNISKLEYIFRLFKDYLKNLSISLGFLLALFIPGIAITSVFKNNFLSNEENIASGFAISIVFLFLITTIAALVGHSELLLLYPALSLFCFYYTYRKGYKIDISSIISSVKVLLVAIVFLTAITFYLENTNNDTFKADYLLPYSVSKVLYSNFDKFKLFPIKDNIDRFLSRDNYDFFISKKTLSTLWSWHFSDRPPLLSVTTLPFLLMFDDKLLIFKTLNTVFTVIMLLPLLEIVKKISNKRISGKVIVPFVLFSSFYIFESINKPNRWFSSYFILLFYLLLLSDKKSFLKAIFSGFVAGLAYLSHSSALFFIAGGLGYLIFSKEFKQILAMLLGLAIPVLPWVLISRIVDRSSIFFLYPFCTEGWGQVFEDPENIMVKFRETPVKVLLKNRLYNFLNLFFYNSKTVFCLKSFFQNIKSYKFSVFTMWGSVGLFLFPFSSLEFLKRLFSKKYWKQIVFLLIVPILIHAVIVIGWYGPIDVMSSLHTAVPVFMALGIYIIMEKRPKLLLPIFIFYFLENIYYYWIDYRYITTKSFLIDFKSMEYIIPFSLLVFVYLLIFVKGLNIISSQTEFSQVD